ncbi:thiol-disulfide oxidoreductase DCC family protein [Paenibacillus tuaregi]|uniref:thiol-disulfide oxidoreductase DCC family protein n=1 Tax=Paenibacillus tuaregi TaxID=1816681 RepID=UPI0008394F81|nr:thiol-disulfide oxidoreductase DCC family protein [Paenibacillus tuaregi]
MSQSPEELQEKPVVLIDGVCHLCQGVTKFLIKRDKKAHLRFCSMQSASGQRLLSQGGLSPASFNTFVLIEEGRYYTRSTAALRLARLLPFPWPLFYLLIMVPRILRDAMYNLIARNRYRWFGKDEACMIPTREIRDRFLD